MSVLCKTNCCRKFRTAHFPCNYILFTKKNSIPTFCTVSLKMPYCQAETCRRTNQLINNTVQQVGIDFLYARDLRAFQFQFRLGGFGEGRGEMKLIRHDSVQYLSVTRLQTANGVPPCKYYGDCASWHFQGSAGLTAVIRFLKMRHVATRFSETSVANYQTKCRHITERLIMLLDIWLLQFYIKEFNFVHAVAFFLFTLITQQKRMKQAR